MSGAISADSAPSGERGAVHGVDHSAVGFDMPRSACDCHVHVMGKPSRYPYAADRVYTPGLATPEDLLAHQRVLSLERVVLVQANPFGTDNSVWSMACAR